jgi:hypothetical protein
MPQKKHCPYTISIGQALSLSQQQAVTSSNSAIVAHSAQKGVTLAQSKNVARYNTNSLGHATAFQHDRYRLESLTTEGGLDIQGP